MAWDLETDTFTPAEGIKEFLAIRLELVLVVHVDNEFLAVENVGNGVDLGVVCHEPVNQTQAYFASSLQEFDDFIQVLATAVKTLEAGDNEFLFAVDLLLSRLRIWCDCGRLLHSDSML